jgi:hypothetical protein
MRYWLREAAGWGLVVIGLFAFYACYAMLLAGQVVEAGAFTVVGIFIFRGGIHLLKMAVAAQVCMEAQRRSNIEEPKPAPPPAIRTSTPTRMRV